LPALPDFTMATAEKR